MDAVACQSALGWFGRLGYCAWKTLLIGQCAGDFFWDIFTLTLTLTLTTLTTGLRLVAVLGKTLGSCA